MSDLSYIHISSTVEAHASWFPGPHMPQLHEKPCRLIIQVARFFPNTRMRCHNATKGEIKILKSRYSSSVRVRGVEKLSGPKSIALPAQWPVGAHLPQGPLDRWLDHVASLNKLRDGWCQRLGSLSLWSRAHKRHALDLRWGEKNCV